jgi:hypothetical protein
MLEVLVLVIKRAMALKRMKATLVLLQVDLLLL